MGQINTGQYNFNTLNTPKIADMTQIYSQVGQQLNKMYYENRQAYITGIANPLSQMKANSEDELLLNNKRNKLTDEANKFKQEDNWHRANNYIFNTVENIMTDEALQLINTKYQQRQQYLQGVKSSKWDSSNQTTFILRSDIQSEAVTEEDGIVKGSFNGISYGEPFDIATEYKRIADIASKAKASGSSGSSISATGAVEQGLASVLQVDGETFVSNYLKSEYSQEGVSYDSLFKFAYNQLANNPQYVSYMKTVSENELFMKRYIPDKTNPKGGYLQELNPQMLKDLFPQSYSLNAIVGAGISLSDLGSLNDDGTFTINSNMSKSTLSKLTKISKGLGFDMVDYLQKGSTNVNNVEINNINDFLDSSFNVYIDNLFNDYLTNNNISKNDSNLNAYKEQWYTNLIVSNNLNTTIKSQADSIASLMSWQKTKTGQSLISNNLASAAYTRKNKQLDAEKQKLETFQGSANLPAIEVSANNIKNIQDENKKYGETLTQLKNESANIPVNSRIYKLLRTEYGDSVKLGDINSIYSLDLSKILNNKSFVLSDDERRTIETLHSNNTAIKQIEGLIDNSNKNFKQIYDVTRNNNDSNSVGVNTNPYYQTVSTSIFKSKTKVLNIEDLLIKENIYNYKDYVNKYGKNIEEDVFNKAQQNLSNRANNINIKKTGNSLTFATNATVLFDYSDMTAGYLNNAINSINTNSGAWTLDSFNGSNKFNKTVGVGINNDEDFVKLLTTHTPKTKSGTIPNIDKVGFDSKKSGLSDKVYDVEYYPVYDPNSISVEGKTKQKVLAVFKDANGSTLGQATISRDINSSTYNSMLQQDYNKFKTASTYIGNNNGESVINESLGNLTSQASQSIYKFSPVSGTNTISANNTLELQARAKNLKLDTGNNDGEKLRVSMNLTLPFNNQTIAQPYLEIQRFADREGDLYKVTMVQQDNNGNWVDASFLNFAGDNNPNNPNNPKFPRLSKNGQLVRNINDAFSGTFNQNSMSGGLTEYLLDIGYVTSLNE